ncbi:hypothetical protein [[Mycobacterium] crassicus]|uniref:HNH endonuclease n=1 Tax=[Mycobacterium] crassicus TaxID=2872309 RepID=A0ABU5XEH6_9MYCO|nr:hypothetical protein [Mycolicibacter sp. MYC098]MEB3020499.1 hypothetical protein [Mycolicibacter sp. MYC098]
MPVHPAPDGGAVAECLRCDTRVTLADVDAADRWLQAHWRVHDGEIGCGRRATPAAVKRPATD